MFTSLKTLAVLGTLTGSALLGTHAASAHEIEFRYPAPVICHNDHRFQDRDYRFDHHDYRFHRDHDRFDRDDHRQFDRHVQHERDFHYRFDARR